MRAALPDAGRGAGILVAFSGGPDSLALLAGAAAVASERGAPLLAAHLDHRLDPGSGSRAETARQLALDLGVPFVLAAAGDPPPRESREAFARHQRYAFLEQAARENRAAAVLTAHHADDQAETVLLRLLFGSGLDGLGGIAARRSLGPSGAAELVRPLLGLRRAELRAAVEAAGLTPVEDPTNLDTRVPRNRIRHLLLPRLARDENQDPVELLCRVAAAGGAAAERVGARLAVLLEATPTSEGARLARRAFCELPETLQGSALSLLHRLAGEGRPAPLEARRELLGQLGRGGKVRCDCGARQGRNFWWQADRYTLELRSAVRSAGAPEPRARQFTYTFEAPGSAPASLPSQQPLGSALQKASSSTEPRKGRQT